MHELNKKEKPDHLDNRIDLMRIEIDMIDKEITRLLERRLDLAKHIGGLKSQSGVPILDEKREEKVLEHIIDNLKNSSIAPAMMRIYECIMNESKDVQSDKKQDWLI